MLKMLVAADLLFLAVHVVHVYTPYLPSPLNSLERDRGHAEVFQYVKLYWLVILFAVLALRERALVHGAWAAVLAYLLADDAFSIHETYGAHVTDALGLGAPLGLNATDLGELVVTGAAAGLLLLLVGSTYPCSPASPSSASSWTWSTARCAGRPWRTRWARSRTPARCWSSA